MATKLKGRPERRPVKAEVPPLPEQRLRDDMWLTYREAAAYVRVTERQIERWVNETGILTCSRLPQGTRINGGDLRDFMESRRER